MSSTPFPVPMISERTGTTVLREMLSGTALAGFTFTSGVLTVPVGKRWQIVNAIQTVQYLTNPGGADSGDGFGEVVNGGVPFRFVGTEAQNIGEQGRQFSGFGFVGPLTLEFGDTVRMQVNAVTSAQNIEGALSIIGWEYDDIT